MILERLKSETHGAHASLEQRLRLTRSCPTLADYRAYLSAMHGFTAPLEARFAHLPSELRQALDLASRNKAHLLRRDLDHLEQRLGPAPRAVCRALPPTDSEASALGVLYVLEGSTLGARHLLRHLQALGIDDSSAYLRSYGEALGEMWRRLRALLVAHHTASPASASEMVSAACQTFELLDAWLVEEGAAEASKAA